MTSKFHPIDKHGLKSFNEAYGFGVDVARKASCEVGMLARDCRVNLGRNLRALERLSEYFQEFSVRSYANDCTDGTEALLDSWRPSFDTTFEYDVLGRPHLGGTRHFERTIALASYRNHVKWMMSDADYYLILDPDLLCIDEERLIAGLGDMWFLGWEWMAAQQLCYVPAVHKDRMINYDAFAWRPDWTWRQDDQRELSFHHDVRPAGCEPYHANSAFGGACWYSDNYRDGNYAGSEGCEHVAFNKSLGGIGGVSPNMSVIGFIQ